MTLVTTYIFFKKVGELFEDRNMNVVILQRQWEVDAVGARDRLIQLGDSLIREVFSWKMGPYQLYNFPYQAKREPTTINN